MATTRIGKRSVDDAKPSASDIYLWDSDLTGFGLKVTPAGRKVYLIQYRTAGRDRRTRRVTLGVHGTLTAEQARTEAKRLLGEAASGRDPAEERRDRADASTMGTLLDQFLVEHVDAKLRASTAGEYRRLSRLYIGPPLRRKSLLDFRRADITQLHLSLKHKPYQANRALALLSKFFNWSEQNGHLPQGSNPCRHVSKYREERRERFLSTAELSRLGETLTANASGETVYVIAAIRLLALTGARLSEILTLRWTFVDFEQSLLRLPKSKTGQKVIYLSPPSFDLLAGLPRLETNPFVIVGDKEGAHLVNLQRPWRRLRAAAGLNDVRIHDLRHSFASVAAGHGQSLPVIGALLGHTQAQTTARYAHLAADPLRAANNAVAASIAGALMPDHVGGDRSIE